MKVNDMNEELMTATQVCYVLNIANKTLNNWYRWYYDDSITKPKDFPKLPDYIQTHERGPRYWTKDDIPKLRAFQEWIPKGRNGVMGDISCMYLKEYKKKKNKITNTSEVGNE